MTPIPLLEDPPELFLTPSFGKIDFYGHSGIAPYGVSDTFKGTATRIARILRADEDNHAIVNARLAMEEDVAGTAGNGGYGRFYDDVKTSNLGPLGESDTSQMPQRGLGVFFWGVMDWQIIGQDETASSGGGAVFKNAARAVTAMWRCARIYEDDDFASGTATVSGTGVTISSVSISTGTAQNGMYITGTGISPGTFIQSGAGTSTLTLSLPLDGTGAGAGTAITLGTVSYSGTWTAVSFVNTTGGRVGHGASARFAGADGNSFTIRTPTTYKGYNAITGGGAVNVFFFMDAVGNSSLWTVSVDGGAGVTYDFRNANGRDFGSTPSAPTNQKRGIAVVRITGLSAGAHTIQCTSTARATSTGATNGGYFDCWGIEAQIPPPVVWFKHARSPIYPSVGMPLQLSDSVVDTGNAMIDKVIKGETAVNSTGTYPSFGPYVQAFDGFYALNKNTSYYLQNNTHLNEEGHQREAREVVRWLLSWLMPLWGVAEQAGEADFGFLTLHPNDKDRNVVQGRNYSECPLTIRNAMGMDQSHTIAGGATWRANAQEWQTHDDNTVKMAISPVMGLVYPALSNDPSSSDLVAGITWRGGDNNMYFYTGGAKRSMTADINSWLAPYAAYTSAPASAAYGSVNLARTIAFVLTDRTTLNGVIFKTGATSSGNVMVAIYDSSGNRLAVSASTAMAAATTIQKISFTAATDTKQGRIFIMVWLSSATGTIITADTLMPASQTIALAGGPATTMTVPTTGLAAAPVCGVF